MGPRAEWDVAVNPYLHVSSVMCGNLICIGVFTTYSGQ